MPYSPQGPYRAVPAPDDALWLHAMYPSANYPGPFLNGTDRYFVLSVNTGEGIADLIVTKSADSGVTWQRQDVAAMPGITQNGTPSTRLDPNTIRICYGSQAGNIPTVRDFDLATDTLGPVLYDCAAYILLAPQPLGYHRSSVAAEDRVFAHTTSPMGENQLTLYRHDDIGGFLPPLVVSDNVLLPATKRIALEAIFMDPAGTSHILYSERPQATDKPRIVYYRQVNAAGVMSVPVAVYTYQFQSSQTFGFPDRMGTMLVFPFPLEHGTSELDQYWTGAALVIDPYTSTTPTVSQIGVPTQRLNSEMVASSGTIHASTLGGQLYLWWVEESSLDGLTPIYRVMYSTFDGGPVPAGTIFHDELASPSFEGPGQPMLCLSPPYMDVADPMLLVGMSGLIGGIPVGPISFFWFTVAGPPGAPPVMQNQGHRRSHVLVPNHWDKCLADGVRRELAISPHKECCEATLWQDIAWIRAPKDYTPFRKVGAIPTPLAISGDVEVFNFQVPPGYDGLIAGLFHLYTGPGFREGGGDIEWRLRVNQTYAIHLGQVLVTLGSRAQSYLLDGGIQIQSGQRIRYIVSAPNLSGGILPLASQIVCGLEGLFYARA
jgi:hypothetical protein